MPNEARPDPQAIRNRLEEYRTTVHALCCLMGALTWDPSARARLASARHSMGRRMDTSPSNAVSPSNTVTPDAVIQSSGALGYVIEAKKSLPRDVRLWEDDAKQLKKYDDDLTGWWTPDGTVPLHNVMLLLEIARSADFRNYLSSLTDDHKLEFVKPFALIEFTPSPNGKMFLFLRKLSGTIHDPSISQQLASGIKVPLEDVLGDYGDKKYYDARPIPEYTMEILWQHVFTPMKESVQYDHSLRAWPLPVSVSHTTHELQRLFGSQGGDPRDVKYPDEDWVEEALDAFVSIGLAKRSAAPKTYVIHFKRLKGDVIERFTLHRAPTDDVAPPEQLPLI